MAQECNPVLVYKPQGSEKAIIGDIDDMAKQNFCLLCSLRGYKEICK